MKTLRLIPALAALLALAGCGVGDATITLDEGAYEENQEALTTPGRFETFVGQDGQYYFHLLAGNGQKVLASEGYSSLSSAKGGISSVRSNGVNNGRYFLREASDGSWYFVLIATNGRIIAVSEMYSSQWNAGRGITRVAEVIRLTVAQGPALAGDPRFEIFRGLDSKYYFHLRARNGEIVLQSQGYASRSGAVSGTNSVANNGSVTSRYEVRAAADGKYYFVLKAGNGWVIGRGETYETKAGAERGVAICVQLLSADVLR
ncbi:MAG: DUF1508 domain-containing protein [Myxococcales bacterium]|nr:DUF1508 domain-containing protein [Myxococcales bacterium]